MRQHKLCKIIIIILTMVFVGCKGNEKLNNNFGTKVFKDESLNKTAQLKNIDAKDTIFWELVDVVRFFDKPIEQEDLDKFKKLDIKFTGDTIIIDKAKAIFVKNEIESKKYFGKGSLYVYFTNYLLDKFNINIKNKVTFLALDYEDARKKPFNYYFLKNDAVYIGDYLFLYNSEDYVLAFKKKPVKKRKDFSSIYEKSKGIKLPLKSKYEIVNSSDNLIKIPNTFQSFLGLNHLDNFSGIKLPEINKNIKPFLVSAYDIAGTPILYMYIFSQDYIFLDKLKLSDQEEIEYGYIDTTYEITENYNIIIKTIEHNDKTNIDKILSSKYYKINHSGKFVEVKK